ncbi:MAG TPA: hypothetical protein ENF57_04355 [Candidatus Korarchaeota archaeon]|nr:hypothetical protein [Candidatus Korarchaeota archaeon]
MKHFPLLLLLSLLLASTIALTGAANLPKELPRYLQTQGADLWSDRGGEGLNVTCGYYKVGEGAVIYFKVPSVMYVELYIIRPDGSKVRIMNASMAGPGTVYKTPPILFIDAGTRIVQLIGARSHAVLDSCKLYVMKGVVGGDVWTENGGRGKDSPGGTFPPLSPIKVAFKVNVTTEVELKAITPKGEQVVFEGVAEAGKIKYVYIEALQEGLLTLKLLHGDAILDTCQLMILLPVEEYPPSLEVERINVDGLSVRIEGKAESGTPNTTVNLIWDWGDGTREEGPFPRSHTYKEGGTYTITIMAQQSDGLSSNFTYVVRVKKPAEERAPKTTSETRTTHSKTTSLITKVITVTSKTERREGFPYQAVAFLLGALVTVVAFILLTRFLGKNQPRTAEAVRGEASTGSGQAEQG